MKKTCFDNRLTCACLACFVFLLAGCASGSELDDGPAFSRFTRGADGTIIERFDINDDGEPDVYKFFVEEPDPDDPSLIRRRIIRKEVDVNFDGLVNMRRHYNDLGQIYREEVDLDLDGKPDIINHIDAGRLVQRDILGEDHTTVRESRYYADGQLIRVERDMRKDGVMDQWEYYEDGVLDRIGRDLTGDGRADSWQTR